MDADQATRIASLEAYSRMYAEDLGEIKQQLNAVREVVDDLRRDLHAARISGRVGLAVAVALGSVGTWLFQNVIRSV